ncbi:MAG TPA: hypothetical protein VLH16_01435 [Bacteroidales bacterium]|nr:hypothetical protein [Bacteroidales bacterium]
MDINSIEPQDTIAGFIGIPFVQFAMHVRESKVIVLPLGIMDQKITVYSLGLDNGGWAKEMEGDFIPD